MSYPDTHFDDQQLLLYIDEELSQRDQELVRVHLVACWRCRARRQELESAIADFVGVYQQALDAQAPPIAGPRALLKAQMQNRAAEPTSRSNWFAVPPQTATALVTGAFGILVLSWFLMNGSIGRPVPSHPRDAIVSSPDTALTPGATVLVSRGAVCAQVNVKNKTVPVALQRQVFKEYGIEGADPHGYEVDYLVTPALGGADDIHNLWPQSYTSTVWNAEVKDALEDYLRDRVCNGTLELTKAQREIADNWIAAYKKYFHTDQPLTEHLHQH